MNHTIRSFSIQGIGQNQIDYRNRNLKESVTTALKVQDLENHPIIITYSTQH